MDIMTKTIKHYIERCHKDGKRPKVSDIAKAFGISCDDVRDHLAEIRSQRGDGVKDFFSSVFGWKI